MPEHIYKIALSLIKGIGPKLARTLVAYFGSVEFLFEEKRFPFDKVPGIGKHISDMLNSINKEALLQKAQKEMDFVAKHGIDIFFFLDDDFPKRLTNCDDAPILLYSMGNADFDSTKMISVVGTRRPTDYGISFCEQIVSELAQIYPDTVIVSGLAYGIDICAHRAALKHRMTTVAVLAHGLDRIYPATHSHTAREMVANGALVAEFMSGTQPDKQNFVRRNRIVAGLSDAVIVVESAQKGGALITASIASDYNRDVFALPGRIGDEASAGCNRLIKSNRANLLESVEDLEYILNWQRNPKSNTIQKSIFAQPETPEEKKIMDILLVEKELNLNVLAFRCELPVGKASSSLLELEFKGLVKSRPGGMFKIV
ncbi:MAG: DNA-processing protein DprA [Cytophagaceae bacterium]|jgi:DNA processing protein|nr:DNA-processing protein DprA [Cytophagaceae bacterium]